ncbi:MAG: choice-of-anchor D domain-containing protein [Formivibrio sp.]|nr:choice-of-anchor D domain-containing protein [Formivibrio sp.]
MNDSTATERLLFPEILAKLAMLEFDQRQDSSDGGSVLLKAAERPYGLIASMSGCLSDPLQAGKVDHSLPEFATHSSSARNVFARSNERDPQSHSSFCLTVRLPAGLIIRLACCFLPLLTGCGNTVSSEHNAGRLTIGATVVTFGNVPLHTIAAQTVTLTSTGTGPVTVSSATVAGTGFTLEGTTFSSTLTPGQTATLGVQFNPSVLGAATGELTITSNSLSNETSIVSLTGTGVSVSYSVDLSWDAPVDSPDPVAGYNIYRLPSGSSTFQLLNSSVETQTAYVDSKVQNGLSYDYIVTSVDYFGVESVPAGPITLTIP